MRREVFALLLLFNAAAPAAFSCSEQSFVLQQVTPDLTVVITHREKPIVGIEVEVTPMIEATSKQPEGSRGPVFSGSTDQHGVVRIRGLLPGKYWLTASHRGFEAGKEWIEVVSAPDAKAKNGFKFQWADWSYQTHRVAGSLTGLIPGNTANRLMDIIHPQATVYPGVSLQLTAAFSDEEYRTLSDSTGFFLIDSVPDGIYILTIAGGMMSVRGIADPTAVVIDVSQGVARAALPLRLRDTGCYRTEFELDEKSQ